MKITIYDEDATLRRGWARELEAAFAGSGDQPTVSSLDAEDFGEQLSTMKTRQFSFRETGTWDSGETKLDSTDVFIVDYELFSRGQSALVTGEMVAYLARCFTSCGLIIGVNQFPVDFDLTLKGHLASFADLNMTDKHLGSRSLWGTGPEPFRAWYWPNLVQCSHDFARRLADVEESLDDCHEKPTPIWKVLGFPSQDVLAYLPRSLSEFLGGDPGAVSFRDFVVDSGNGLRPKDAVGIGDRKKDREVIARLGAARIAKWLERFVLPEQNVLVDAPHLVSRLPGLLEGDTEDEDAWNRTADLTSSTGGLVCGPLESARFGKAHWVSRPVWLWDNVVESEDVLEVGRSKQVTLDDWVFLEDMSQFGRNGREFVADVESSFRRRYVRQIQGLRYQPSVRFAMS